MLRSVMLYGAQVEEEPSTQTTRGQPLVAWQGLLMAEVGVTAAAATAAAVAAGSLLLKDILSKQAAA